MALYTITEQAGLWVAGHRNTGAGTQIDLDPRQAEHDLRLGNLAPYNWTPEADEGEAGEEPAPAPEEAQEQPRARGRGKGRDKAAETAPEPAPAPETPQE